MAVPKKKTPSGRRDRRRSHHGVRSPQLAKCPQCQEPIVPHQVCPSCGYYKGRDILKIEEAEAKKEAKKKARKDRAKQK